MTENEEIHTLVRSSTSGKYALDEADGPDISAGTRLYILLNGQWIPGQVEYARRLYVNMGPQFWGDKPHLPEQIDGYYLETGNGICGLCVGMRVRLG